MITPFWKGGEGVEEDKIIAYVEPIFCFCCKRLSNRYDAEDLASEIICYILDGMKRYKIESFDAWVWRIAHNRYARFIDARNKEQAVVTEDDTRNRRNRSMSRYFVPFTHFLPSTGIFLLTTISER